MLFSMASSSALRLPEVFCWSMLRMSMVCLAMDRFFSALPDTGSSITPRCTRAEAFSEAVRLDPRSYDDAFSLACELGVHELSLYEIVAVGRWASHESEVLSDRDVLRLERFHKEKNRGDGPRVTALPYLLGPEMFGCFAGRRWIHVDGDGKALPCAYMPLSFGNIKERRLKDIWKDMTAYQWFQGRCSCQMRDRQFREAHRDILEG